MSAPNAIVITAVCLAALAACSEPLPGGEQACAGVFDANPEYQPIRGPIEYAYELSDPENAFGYIDFPFHQSRFLAQMRAGLNSMNVHGVPDFVISDEAPSDARADISFGGCNIANGNELTPTHIDLNPQESNDHDLAKCFTFTILGALQLNFEMDQLVFVQFDGRDSFTNYREGRSDILFYRDDNNLLRIGFDTQGPNIACFIQLVDRSQ